MSNWRNLNSPELAEGEKMKNEEVEGELELSGGFSCMLGAQCCSDDKKTTTTFVAEG
jgi:hypothetical protein